MNKLPEKLEKHCEKLVPVWLISQILELWNETDKMRDDAYDDLLKASVFSNIMWAVVCVLITWIK